ncbi:DUF368 domain-containing protein [Halanaerobium hydrogeniformans]|uniref:DUF368 domain-containing protein n=1 Tax=Halanaerobium hydrogeniformans TaxID=656519 RepID=E4RIV5_HALHG|nr:DUF368 domain-containing protein [Halanaerobium hydrogeniformans]ADQ15175.1 protein of unknown function DUF368 [Halanaerobium hydrogeniformans]
MSKKTNYISLFFKSIPIGIANTLPGVSGGTIALVLNIYETLIYAIKNISYKKLSVIGLGALLGVYIGAAAISDFYYNNPLLLNYFLFGLVLTSAHATYHKIGRLSFLKILFLLAAFALALFVSMEIGVNINAGRGLMLYFWGGFWGSIAMIVPGISGSTLLVLMGLYHPVLSAVNNFEILYLSVFTLGIIFGLLIFAWLFSYLLKRYHQQIMTVLTGLILGSSAAVFPAKISLEGVYFFFAGAVIILILEFFGKKF